MKRIHFPSLQNAEHFALMQDVLLLISEANITELNEIKSDFAKNIALADTGMNQIRKSEHTEKLIVLDSKRDNMFRGLSYRVQSEEFSLNKEIQDAAKKIRIVLNTYGNVTLSNYQKETIEIKNLIQDLQSSTYKPSADKIGLEQWISWLEEANTNFEKSYVNRRDSYAEQGAINLRSVRKQLDEQFVKIRKIVEALNILKPSNEVSTLTSKMNVSLQKWSDIIAQRKGKKKSDNSSDKETTVV